MRIPSRITFRAVLATSIAVIAGHSLAQTHQHYPTRPIRLVVPAAPGNQTDAMARMIGPKLSERWGQPVVVENRPGASDVLGTAIVAKAVPDGHTLLLTSPSFAVNAALNPNLPYDPLKDFAGVTPIGFSTQVLVVAPSLGVKSIPELIARAKEVPGKLFFGSSGAGTPTHINAEKFRIAAGITATHVAFKGLPETLVEVMAGRVHFSVSGLMAVLPLVTEGRVAALAVTTPQRSPVLPDVPAIAEALPGYRTHGATALLAPARTPRPILQQVSREVGLILGLPEIMARMQAFGFVPAPTTPEEHDRILKAEIATFAEVVTTMGLRPR